jgi:hypothetical protein
MAVEGAMHVCRLHGEANRFAPAAVEDRGDEALPAEASDRPLPDGLAGLD